MAKATKRKLNKIDLENLSDRDREFLTMDTKDVMKKYKLEKQNVYDRRFALNKKIREAGLSLEDVLNGSGVVAEEAANEAPSEAPKKAAAKKAAPKKAKRGRVKKAVPAEEVTPEAEVKEPSRDIVKYEKPVPVIMKPIEINFENFSIRLNGVPKKIAVNPDTNAIEIDL